MREGGRGEEGNARTGRLHRADLREAFLGLEITKEKNISGRIGERGGRGGGYISETRQCSGMR